jgi:phosphocarrier protein HPr
MIQTEAVVKDPTGLHARPAALFAQSAKAFASKVTIGFGGREADAKSVMSVMALGIKCESTIELSADGPDEQNAVEKLKSMLEAGSSAG